MLDSRSEKHTFLVLYLKPSVIGPTLMSCFVMLRFIAVPRLAQLDKRRSAKRDVGGFNPRPDQQSGS